MRCIKATRICSASSHTSGLGDKFLSDLQKSLLLDPGAETFAPNLSNAHLEVIGDSISTGWGCANQIFDNYGWLIGEMADSKIVHVDSTGGLSGDVLHPLEMQNREITDQLKPIVAEYMAK